MRGDIKLPHLNVHREFSGHSKGGGSGGNQKTPELGKQSGKPKGPRWLEVIGQCPEIREH